MTPAASQETLATLSSLKNNVEVLRLDIQEIENSIYHLKRSNKELQDAFAADADPSFVVQPVLVFFFSLPVNCTIHFTIRDSLFFLLFTCIVHCLVGACGAVITV
jgi:hypothetical protein